VRYFGGKHRSAKEIAHALNLYLKKPGAVYIEPFCGGLNVTQFINPRAERIAMDYHEGLIRMYQAIQNGWEPPNEVSEARYAELKAQTFFTPEKVFAGFACSFGGKYFRGYARNGKNGYVNYADTAKRGLARKFEGLQGVTFRHGDFLKLENVSGAVIYCDPPYADTSGYSLDKFDSGAFWQKVRDLSGDNLVFVSEYKAPEDFTEVWRKEVRLYMQSKKGKEKEKRIEKLFIYI